MVMVCLCGRLTSEASGGNIFWREHIILAGELVLLAGKRPSPRGSPISGTVCNFLCNLAISTAL